MPIAKHIRTVIIFITAIILLSNHAVSQDSTLANKSFVFENISMKEGLSNLEVRSICQDKLGYIWVGTDRGLDRFDGTQLEPFSSLNDEQIIHNSIWGLHSLSDAIVIETPRELYHYDLYTEEFSPLSRDVHFFHYDRLFDNSCVWHDRYYVLKDGSLLYLDEKQLQFKPVLQFPNSLKITNTYSDELNGIWCTQANDEDLVLFDPTNGKVWFYDIYHDNPLVNASEIQDIKEINGLLWIATKRGLLLYDYVRKTSLHNPKYEDLLKSVAEKDIRFIESKRNEIWIGTYSNGLYIYYPENNTFENVAVDNEAFGLKTNNLTASLIDRDHNVWLGTFNKGIQVYFHNQKKFNTNKYINAVTKGKFINCILTDSSNTFYFGTRYNGIITFDPQTLNNSNYHAVNSDLNDNHITSLFLDSQGKIWIGQTDALQIFDPQTREFKTVELSEDYGEVVSIMEFNGDVFICGDVSVSVSMSVFDLKGGLIKQLTGFGDNIRQTIPLNDKDMLVCGHGTAPGLESRLAIYTPETNTISKLEPTEKPQAWKEQFFITSFMDSDGILWIGSFYWGLLRYDLARNEFEVFNKKSGLPSNDVVGITEDDAGNLWLSTYYGLSCFDKKESFVNYFIDEGINNQQFHQKAVYKDKDGTIYFGGYEGITYFNPEEILSASEDSLKMLLKSLNVNYDAVSPGDEHRVLEESLPYTSSITLSHLQRSFSIDYVAFNYGLAHKIEYAYVLEGFDDEWLSVGNATRAVFSNLRPGNYIFKVKARIAESGWSKNKTLKIRVKNTPWLSAWAIALYLIAILAIIIIAFRLVLRAKLYRKDLEIEQLERHREKEINQMKLRFFTNISHELRTPLTIISTMVYMMYKQFSPLGQSKELFGSLRLNVDRLLKLINQLLLFREMENDVMKLQLTKTPLKDILQQAHKEFLHFATLKKIDLEADDVAAVEGLIFLYDYDKVEKILANLISNALKHTPQYGTVSVSGRELSKSDALAKYEGLDNYDFQVSQSGYIQISVKDTGVGMNERELSSIFERYRKTERDDKKLDYSGTGIGLDFTKRLINLHKGDIIVESVIDQGTTFSFILPIDRSVYADEFIVEARPITQASVFNEAKLLIEDRDTIASETGEKKYKVAVIEDNEELCDLIVEILSHKYEVLSAYNGLEGYHLIEREIPDLIISDVMMPKMDGLTLCDKIKNNDLLDHIYLILLSAKSEVEDQIKGMEKGADMYINKPFNVDYLLAVINAHFVRNKKLGSIFQEGLTPALDKGEVNNEYREFIDRLNVILDNHLGNEKLNVQLLAAETNMSRSVFYKKFVSMTGITPNAYIVKYRINRSIELMQHTDDSISQISEMLGFSSASYFSTTFKKEKGISPSQYLKNKQKTFS